MEEQLNVINDKSDVPIKHLISLILLNTYKKGAVLQHLLRLIDCINNFKINTYD
jgi:hypothetical protein